MAIQDIYNRLAQATGFHPGQTEVFDDFLLDAGDVIQIFSEGEAFDLPIFKQHIDWVGSAMTTLTSTGNEQRSDLPPLQKKQKNRSYRTGRRLSDQEEQLVGYRADFIRTKKTVGMEAKAMGIQLDQDGNPVLDQDGEFVWDNTSAAEIFSRLILSPNRAELVSAINNGTGAQVSGSKIDLSAQGKVLIQAINNRPDTESSVKIEADKIHLEGYVTASYVDATILKVDQLTTNTGFAGTLYLTGNTGISANGAVNAGSVSAGTINASTFRLITGDDTYSAVSQKDVTIAGTALPNLHVLGTGSATSVAIPNAIATIVVDDNPPSGKIGFKYTTFANSTPVAVNFNIADTAKYQADVGIASVSAAGWTNDGGGGGYYNTVTATPNAGSASTETVVLPTITVDTTLGTNASTALTAYGPTVGTTKYPVSASTTVYLKANSNYCYITNTASDPVEGANGNIIAKIANPGGGKGTVTAITTSAIGRNDVGVSAIGVTGTNLNAFTPDATFSLATGTYEPSSASTATKHCVNLKHGTTIVGRVDTESVYTDGVAAGEAKFAQATVTPQGASAGTIYKRKATSGRLRLSRYSSSSVELFIYERNTYYSVGSHVWWYQSSNGTYYYLGDGEDSTLYQAGTPDSTTYYTKTSS